MAALAQHGDPQRFHFPRPMLDRPGLDFSFSGLKTFALNTLRDHPDDPHIKADIARAFEDAVVATLTRKCLRAVEQTGLKRLVVAGGVGANRSLRQHLQDMMTSQDGAVFFPRPEFCTDNGAMIAYAGFLRFKAGQKDETLEIRVNPRWSLSELSIP